MPSVVEVRGLTKTFGTTRALDSLDLEVLAGEVHGFLGPNGAGKTTLLRILLGLLRADEGAVRVLGLDPWRDASRLHRRLAYVPGDVTLWPALTGGEVMRLLGQLHGSQDLSRLGDLTERFRLDPSKRTKAYSKGNRQKVVLVAALACDAELYLLDEPTSGLDPLMEAEFRDVVNELRGQGRTVLLSSHILSEAEALSDSVSIISEGRLVEAGSLADLRHLLGTSVIIELAQGAPLLNDDSPLRSIAGVTAISATGRRMSFRVEESSLPEVMKVLGAAEVATLEASPPTLEEMFLRHYGSS